MTVTQQRSAECYVLFYYAECRKAECCYAECRGAKEKQCF